MEDLIELFLSILDDLLPQKLNEWIYNQKKPIRYILVVLLGVFALALFFVVLLLIYSILSWIIKIIV